MKMGWLDEIFKKSENKAPVQSDAIIDAEFEEIKAENENPTISSNNNKPGEGVLHIKFNKLKTGGFKVWLFFWLLGEGKKDPKNLFTVREVENGLRIFMTGSSADQNVSEFDGVLDFLWGDSPQPFLRVDRYNLEERIPYKGELDILNKLIDALVNLEKDRVNSEEDKLFLLDENLNEINDSKAKLAHLASQFGC
eukprot:CAMPEP_0171453406 /NCGR_PEP_ID=MMETSP0945-20130129/1130_1 /TAXON_ID=109269 /ORGANISM="Vaucheria litorea, Strain CCMP2940" /LENGTH=194 /DNA_ID=CAMNT_0011978273 /DNA_START=129 /DNA_END=713 /DNA_ORIENTATION=+